MSPTYEAPPSRPHSPIQRQVTIARAEHIGRRRALYQCATRRELPLAHNLLTIAYPRRMPTELDTICLTGLYAALPVANDTMAALPAGDAIAAPACNYLDLTPFSRRPGYSTRRAHTVGR